MTLHSCRTSLLRVFVCWSALTGSILPSLDHVTVGGGEPVATHTSSVSSHSSTSTTDGGGPVMLERTIERKRKTNKCRHLYRIFPLKFRECGSNNLEKYLQSGHFFLKHFHKIYPYRIQICEFKAVKKLSASLQFFPETPGEKSPLTEDTERDECVSSVGYKFS